MTPLTIWPLQLGVFVVERVALGLANLLDHHLLGGLGADAADGFFRVERLAFERAGDRAVFAVDLDFDVGFFAVVLLGGRDEGGFDAFEDDFLVDILVAVNRVDDSQHFVWIHGNLSPRCIRPTARQIKLSVACRAAMAS